MKLFYGIMIIDIKALKNFLKQLPGASRYAMRK